MLEERLSKAYSQQSLGGYSLPPPRQASGPYPSIPAQAPAGAGGAESYYTGPAPVGYAMAAAQPFAQPSQPTPQPQQFSPYSPTPGPLPGQAPPRLQGQAGDGWQARQPSAPLETHAQQQQSPADAAPPTQTPLQPSASPSADRRASYYVNAAHPCQAPPGPLAAGPAPDAGAAAYPNLQRAMQYQSAPPMAPSQPTPAQQYAQASHGPLQFQQAAPGQQAAQQPPAQAQAYWRQQQQQGPAQAATQQAQQQPAWAHAAYGQDAFPSVPQSDPVRQPVVEEALIEL